MVDAIVTRFIPADDLSPSGKDAGCTVFIDRQLAGPYGTYEWLYMKGPFSANPLPTQGIQSPLVPQQQYRQGLAALAAHCRDQFGGKRFEQLTGDEQDGVLRAMEKNELQLGQLKRPLLDAKMFFDLLLQNTMEGFFADPVYGGNRDMVGWKMVGFPGTRYDFRDVLANPGQVYNKPPVSIIGRPAWNGRPA
nr:gluconate 2-dehydrogenase subunit 3 family protein [Pseudoroseomonas aerophila]